MPFAAHLQFARRWLCHLQQCGRRRRCVHTLGATPKLLAPRWPTFGVLYSWRSIGKWHSGVDRCQTHSLWERCGFAPRCKRRTSFPIVYAIEDVSNSSPRGLMLVKWAWNQTKYLRMNTKKPHKLSNDKSAWQAFEKTFSMAAPKAATFSGLHALSNTFTFR